jgi:transcriptional antiterminator RfaH
MRLQGCDAQNGDTNIMSCSKIEAQAKVAQTPPEPAWYCVRSQNKHEHIAAAHLRMLEGVIVFCPRIRFKRATRRGVVQVTEGMFPGYLFARFRLSEMHRHVRYSHGVIGIVRFGERYAVIEEGALAQLRDRTDSAEIKELNYELSQGGRVNITEGAFVGLETVITQVLPAKQRVKVLMEFLGRNVEAEVEQANVLPQVGHPLAA